MNILEARGLTVRYGRSRIPVTAVHNVSFDVPKQGSLGLVGESGCGKSSLARAIVGLAPIVAGQLVVDSVDYTSPGSRGSMDFKHKVQMVFQDPFSSLNPRLTVAAAIAEAVQVGRQVSSAAARAEVARLLGLVGLPESASNRYPHQFSGGERQRLAICRALAVGAKLIILDEVTSALDVSVQATLLNLLKNLKRELGLSYLVISHDLATVRFICDAVMVMYFGEIVERARTIDLFQSPHHPYTRSLISSIPRLSTHRTIVPIAGDLPDPRYPPAGCRFHTRCLIGPLVHPERTICRELNPQVIANAQPNQAACHFASPSDDERFHPASKALERS